MEATETLVSNADRLKLEELDRVFAEMSDLDLGDETDAVEEIVEAEEDEIDRLEGELLKTESYDDAESVSDAIDDITAEPERVEKPKRVAKPRVSEKAKSPKIERDLDALPFEAFVLSSFDVTADAACKAATLARRPAQKKVGEKFDNVLISLAANRLPSTYVVDALKLLLESTEPLSAKMLAAMWKGRGLNEGTAASQSGQIMSLFPALGIATREGYTLRHEPKSVIASKIAALMS